MKFVFIVIVIVMAAVTVFVQHSRYSEELYKKKMQLRIFLINSHTDYVKTETEKNSEFSGTLSSTQKIWMLPAEMIACRVEFDFVSDTDEAVFIQSPDRITLHKNGETRLLLRGENSLVFRQKNALHYSGIFTTITHKKTVRPCLALADADSFQLYIPVLKHTEVAENICITLCFNKSAQIVYTVNTASVKDSLLFISDTMHGFSSEITAPR